jgi:hypothetical protein
VTVITLVTVSSVSATRARVTLKTPGGTARGGTAHHKGEEETMSFPEAAATKSVRRKPRSSGGKSVAYASATSGNRAREEVLKILRGFGCEEAGFFDKWEDHEVLLQFKHRGRQVQLRASAKGWATLWLKKNPLSHRARKSEHEHKQEALNQGHLAVSSALRDWVKGQITMIEAGFLSFESVFLPHMLTHDGRPLIERVGDLLPQPDEPKVVEFKGSGTT